jgi:hypothetical protein
MKEPMKESDYNLLREKSWRQELSAAEKDSLRAYLAEHPEAADWEMEGRLTEALERADVPVPSNFTARVLAAIEREALPVRRATPGRWFFRLLPKVAVAAVIFSVGLFTYHEHTTAERAELVQGVKVVAGVSLLPSPEILQDFDTIRQMSASPGPDTELITLLK